jgi:regulator of protease activity HflC (stomatin/prohibitin superfamily)
MERLDFESPSPESNDPGDKPQRPNPIARVLGRLRQVRLEPPQGGLPWKRLSLAALVIVAALVAGKFVRASFRSIDPGYVGVSVSRFSGSMDVLAPGTHFRPRLFYEIHPVRVSDQLLAGDEAIFKVSTREGVMAQVSIQARWAVDRGKLLTKWAALPPDPGRELVAPVVAAAFRAASPRYEVLALVAEKREELAQAAARVARERLADSGIQLKEVLIGEIVLPPEFERGRVAMVDEVQNTERMEVTLKLKEKEVVKTRLEAEAQKARQIEAAEAMAAQRVIGAKAEAEAMKFVLALKEKEIQQKKLEAEADKESRVKKAKADAEITRIAAEAESERRRKMADAEAYSIRQTTTAQFENLQREAELVTAHPLLIPKTFADRLAEDVQVILTPSIGGEAFTDEVLRRAASGVPPVEPRPDRPATTKLAKKKN